MASNPVLNLYAIICFFRTPWCPPSLLEFPRKPTLRQRLTCRRFAGECFWYQHPGKGREGSRVGQRIRSSWMQSHWKVCQSCRELWGWGDPSELPWAGVRGLGSIPFIHPPLDVGCWKWGSLWLSLEIPKGVDCWGLSASCNPSSWDNKCSYPEGWFGQQM